MSGGFSANELASSERLLTFEVAGSVYALPIAQVLEVAQRDRITCVPSLPRQVGGVMNWHGEAIPVISAHLLLDASAEAGGAAPARSDVHTAEHVLVVSDRADATPSLGLPVDQVVGLVDGRAPSARDGELVVERRSVDGRVVSILNPRGLVSRAGTVIKDAIA